MRVLTVSCFSPVWGRYPVDVLDLEKGPTVGGGEEAFLRTAVGLKALGHEVLAYHCGESGTWRGVEFRGTEKPLYPVIVGEQWDAVCAWSGIRPLEYARPGVKRLLFQQLNDLFMLGDWNAVDCIVSPSRDHARALKAWGWPGRQAVVHNGIDPLLYEDAPAWDDRPLHVGYWSSPDRGLHHLLRAWPYVIAKEPSAHLHVFYEVKRYLALINMLPANFYGERGQTVGRLVLDHLNDPTVTFHGAVPRRKLAQTQKQCRVHCYPYETFGYCEGFAISVANGLAAGCTVMSTPKDALPSLYGDAVHWLPKNCTDLDYPEWLAEQVVLGLWDELEQQDAVRARGPKVAARYTWDEAATQMEAVCSGTWLPAGFEAMAAPLEMPSHLE